MWNITRISCGRPEHRYLRGVVLFLAFFCCLGSLAAQETEIYLPVTIRTPAYTETLSTLVRVDDSLDLIAIDGATIVDALERSLSVAAGSELRARAQDGWLTASEFAALEILIDFDSATLTATVTVPMEAMGTREIDMFGEQSLPPYDHAPSADFAVSLPVWFDADGTNALNGTSAHTYGVTGAPAFSLYSWVLEGDLELRIPDSAGSSTEFEYENIRLVRLWPESGVRFQAGQITPETRGIGTASPRLALSLDNLDADNNRAIVPALFDRPLVVDAPGRIDVEVNGRRIRSTQVQPGRYDLRNLPVPAGVNSVVVIYRRADGSEERFQMVIPYAGGLLEEGALSYAIGGGVEEDHPDRAGGAGFLRYGLSDRVTAGVLADVNTERGQVGLEGTMATTIGEPSVAAYGSLDNESTVGWATRVGYRLGLLWQPWLPILSSTLEYRSDSFDDSSQSWQATSSLTQRLPGSVGLTLSHVYRTYHTDTATTSFLYGSVSRRFGRSVTARLGGFVDTESPWENWGATITLSWQAVRRGVNGTAVVDARNETADLTVSASDPRGVSGSLGAQEIGLSDGTVGAVSASGRVSAARFDASLQASADLSEADRPGDQDLDMVHYGGRLGIAAYYAGGAFAIARPLRSAFVLVRPDRDLPAPYVSVDRRSGPGGRYRSGILGAAVIGPLQPGNPTPLVVEVPGLPVDYSLGPTDYIVDPGYRSGTAITIRTNRRLYVRGTLVTIEGDPVSYVGLSISPLFEVQKDSETAPVGGASFTDETGTFDGYELVPGEYRVDLQDGSERSFVIAVPDEEGPLILLGEIVVPGGYE